MISLCITHRVDEDISWVEDLYSDLLIYNKGSKWDLPYEHKIAPKIVSEADTYIRGIIDSYDELYRYRWVFLLLPNCKDFDSNLINHLTSSQYIGISDEELTLLSKETFNFNFESYKQFLNENNSSGIELQAIEFVENVLKNLQIFDEKQDLLCSPMPQFVVPIQFITSKPKSWWILLHSYVLQMNEMFGPSLSQIFTIMWCFILNNLQ